MLLVAAFVSLFFLPTPWGFIVVGAAAVVEVAEVYLWIRFLRRYRVQTGVEGLIGREVEVVERCDPEGRVKFMGELWKARSEGDPIEAGDRAPVERVEGLTLVLESPSPGALR